MHGREKLLICCAKVHYDTSESRSNEKMFCGVDAIFEGEKFQPVELAGWREPSAQFKRSRKIEID